MAPRRDKKLQELKRQQRRRAARPPGGEGRDGVVGFFGVLGFNVLCDGDACVITGTREALQRAHEQFGRTRSQNLEIRSTTFAEIWCGVQLGGAYAFDEEAYRVFRPLAEAAGWPLAEAGDPAPQPTPPGLHLIRVQWLR